MCAPHWHAVSADALLALSADKRFLFHPEDDAFVILYTSGTTGRPKGCITTHRGTDVDFRPSAPTSR